MKLIKKEVIYDAIEFNSKIHPYHHSIQRQTLDGKIPDFESYFCIIPVGRIESINDGDFILIDSMNNAIGVVYKNFNLKEYKIKESM